MEPFRKSALSRREFIFATAKALALSISLLFVGCAPDGKEPKEYKPAQNISDKLKSLGLEDLELLIPIKLQYEKTYGTFPTIGIHQLLDLLFMLENNIRNEHTAEQSAVLTGAWASETNPPEYAKRYLESIRIEYIGTPVRIDSVRNYLSLLSLSAPVLIACLPGLIQIGSQGGSAAETQVTIPPLPPANDDDCVTFLHEIWHVLDGSVSALYRIKPLVSRADYVTWVCNLMKVEQAYIRSVVDTQESVASAGIWVHNWNDQNQTAARSLVDQVKSLNLALGTGVVELVRDHITLADIIEYWTASVKSAVRMQMARSQQERYALGIESQRLYKAVFKEGLRSADGSMHLESLFQACNHKLIEPPTISIDDPPFNALPEDRTAFPADQITTLRVRMFLERIRFVTSLNVDQPNIFKQIRTLFSIQPRTN